MQRHATDVNKCYIIGNYTSEVLYNIPMKVMKKIDPIDKSIHGCSIDMHADKLGLFIELV